MTAKIPDMTKKLQLGFQATHKCEVLWKVMKYRPLAPPTANIKISKFRHGADICSRSRGAKQICFSWQLWSPVTAASNPCNVSPVHITALARGARPSAVLPHGCLVTHYSRASSTLVTDGPFRMPGPCPRSRVPSRTHSRVRNSQLEVIVLTGISGNSSWQ